MLKRHFDEKKRKEEERAKIENRAKQFKIAKIISVFGLVVGAAGGILGVLFAPKAGAETREDLKSKAEQIKKHFHRSDVVETCCSQQKEADIVSEIEKESKDEL